MGDIIPISGDFYTWSEENVNNVKEKGATYGLFENHVLRYIGSTHDLSERLKKYWSTKFKEDPCKKITNSYKREYRTDYVERETELLEEYKAKHGKLPKCNDKIP